ncbi:type I restriction enzyme endonuclease domain-containing protein, partial [Micrococcus luteus]|uniref:type I restriction enzyme endonuclease domain-containing protein n=1 Tax=Micrococcus luteus TaxID=1270 RepID=UPI0030185E65
SRVLWKVRSKAPTVTASVQGTVSVTGEGYTTIRDSTRKYSEMLEETVNRYTNRSLTTAEIIAELVKLAKQMRDAQKRHEELGLREDEVAFYDAVVQNDSAVMELGDETLKAIAQELVTSVRQSATIDWNLKESVLAAMRSKVRRILAKYDYPPDAEAKAIELVIEQAELFARGVSA